MKLSPGDYIFTVAPIRRQLGGFSDHDSSIPKDLYISASKWFFVEAVALTSGGGSYRDNELRDRIAAVGTTVQALWAKAKSDVDPADRPFQAGDKVLLKYRNSEADDIVRTVIEVDDTDRGQYVWLAPEKGCHHFTNDQPAGCLKKVGE